ncbi:hypothetical protein Trydic_g5487 [Trypoxylus dichotomus]
MKNVAQFHQFTVLNELSSDHNPVLLQLGQAARENEESLSQRTVSWPAFTDHFSNNIPVFKAEYNQMAGLTKAALDEFRNQRCDGFIMQASSSAFWKGVPMGQAASLSPPKTRRKPSPKSSSGNAA